MWDHIVRGNRTGIMSHALGPRLDRSTRCLGGSRANCGNNCVPDDLRTSKKGL